MKALDAGSALLTRCRQGEVAWGEVACGDSAGDDGLWWDPNADLRYTLLRALQYDLQPGDSALVRYLIEQETLHHRRLPLQGLHDAMPLAGYLLASFHEIEHVWLFAEAKRANFDTYMGFDRMYLVSAGIEETLAYVRKASTHALQHDVLEWLVGEDGQCVISEDDLASWWQSVVSLYPARWDDETLQSRLGLALEFGDRTEARRYLEEWESTLARTPRDLASLAWYWAQIPDWDRAGAITAEFLRSGGLDARTRASMQLDAIGYHRQAGRALAAWQQFATLKETLEDIKAWWKTGLGRMVIEEALLIAQAVAPKDNVSQEAYVWASEQLSRRGVATFHLLQLAEVAAAHMGDKDGRARYAQQAQRIMRRIKRT